MAFLDEPGFLLAAWLRRSWAPKGQTPVIPPQVGGVRKASVIAALCVAPTRDRLRLYFRLHPGVDLNAQLVRACLPLLAGQLGQRIIVRWDRWQGHRAKLVQSWLEDTPQRIPEGFPPYAPELNPLAYAWGYLQCNPLANGALAEVDQLATPARRHGRCLQHNERLLHAFIRHRGLP